MLSALSNALAALNMNYPTVLFSSFLWLRTFSHSHVAILLPNLELLVLKQYRKIWDLLLLSIIRIPLILTELCMDVSDSEHSYF
jgi:hypothetical protein